MPIFWSLKQIPELSGLSPQQRRLVFGTCYRRHMFSAPITFWSVTACVLALILWLGAAALTGPILDWDDYRGLLLVLLGVASGWFILSRTAMNHLRPFYRRYLPGNLGAAAPVTKVATLTVSRSFGTLVTSVILLLWGFGIRDAILGGLQPAMHVPYTAYATIPVLVVCGIITGEAAILYAVLRPFSFSRRPGRAFIALAVFVVLWRLDYNLGSAWTDQPGWCYSNLFFLRTVVISLLAIGCGSSLALIVRWLRVP
jgi:hypothetical protein